MELVNMPRPVPSVVWLLVTTGFDEVLQQMPLAVTEEPPSAVTFPPPDAVVVVIEPIADVVTVGKDPVVADEVKLISFPYAVPFAFVA